MRLEARRASRTSLVTTPTKDDACDAIPRASTGSKSRPQYFAFRTGENQVACAVPSSHLRKH